MESYRLVLPNLHNQIVIRTFASDMSKNLYIISGCNGAVQVALGGKGVEVHVMLESTYNKIVGYVK